MHFDFLITLLNLEIGRFYQNGVKYKAVWDRMHVINKNAKLLTKAVEAGLDPFKVELSDGAPVKAQGNKGFDFLPCHLNCTTYYFLVIPCAVCCFTIPTLVC
jgi:hypothetical protein